MLVLTNFNHLINLTTYCNTVYYIIQYYTSFNHLNPNALMYLITSLAWLRCVP
jgi:hypothetical protein